MAGDTANAESDGQETVLTPPFRMSNHPVYHYPDPDDPTRPRCRKTSLSDDWSRRSLDNAKKAGRRVCSNCAKARANDG